MVLFIGYGQRILGCGDDGKSTNDLCFIHASGLYEWLRMEFVLKNVPQIYQRTVDNSLYGYFMIGDRPKSNDHEASQQVDVFRTANQTLTGTLRF